MYAGEHTAGWTTAISRIYCVSLTLDGTNIPSLLIFIGDLVIQNSKWITTGSMVVVSHEAILD